jgi:hypothetical protein
MPCTGSIWMSRDPRSPGSSYPAASWLACGTLSTTGSTGLPDSSGSAGARPLARVTRSAAGVPRRQTRTFRTLAWLPGSARRNRPSSRTGSAAPPHRRLPRRGNRDEGGVAQQQAGELQHPVQGLGRGDQAVADQGHGVGDIGGVQVIDAGRPVHQVHELAAQPHLLRVRHPGEIQVAEMGEHELGGERHRGEHRRGQRGPGVAARARCRR